MTEFFTKPFHLFPPSPALYLIRFLLRDFTFQICIFQQEYIKHFLCASSQATILLSLSQPRARFRAGCCCVPAFSRAPWPFSSSHFLGLACAFLNFLSPLGRHPFPQGRFHIVYIYHTFFIFSSVVGYLRCFHILSIVNNAAMNTGMHISFPNRVFIFSSYLPKSGS